MSTSLQRLLPLFDREVASGRPVVLGTVVSTAGPTYTKAGAQMLIAEDGEYAGLLSGGCLEGDLREHARRVFSTGAAELVSYDMRGPDDQIFGLGSGCEGAMTILLQRLDSKHDWQPLTRLAAAWRARRNERLLLIVCPGEAGSSCVAGTGVFLPDSAPFGAPDRTCVAQMLALAESANPARGSCPLTAPWQGGQLLLLDQPAPPRLLLLGAGPDAQPVVQLATFLGWGVTVIDHRSHYARPERFPGADAVIDGGVQALEHVLKTGPQPAFDAAVVMSHHLNSDRAYLHELAGSGIGYVGLLGPAARRDRLLGELGDSIALRLKPSLRAPVGLDLGAGTPEGIALSMVAEIHAALAGDVSMLPLSALRAVEVRVAEVAS